MSVNHASNNLCTWHSAFSRHRMDSSLWFKRMELIEAKSLNWTQRGKLDIIYENVMWILWILRFKSIHLLFYTFRHIIHMYISNDSNVILKYFHFILLVVTFRFTLLMLSNGPPSSIAIAHRWSWDSRFTKINNTVRAIFIYSFMLWCQCFNCWQSFKFNMGRLIESV